MPQSNRSAVELVEADVVVATMVPPAEDWFADTPPWVKAVAASEPETTDAAEPEPTDAAEPALAGLDEPEPAEATAVAELSSPPLLSSTRRRRSMPRDYAPPRTTSINLTGPRGGRGRPPIVVGRGSAREGEMHGRERRR